MLNLIVLGYIPGTTIQINFFHVLIFVFCLLTLLLLILLVQTITSRRKFQSTLGFCLRSLSRQMQRAQTANLA
jgi:hypothetical protein